MAEPVNFVFFITDQHRADYLGCSGHPVLKTPNIDRIAAGGTRFDRFHVTNPVCMPNRAALMTGRWPSINGARANGIPLSMEANTFTDVLRAGGYKTALVGKSHLQTFTGKPSDWGPNPAGDGPLANAEKPDGHGYHYEEPPHWMEGGPGDLPLPYYGFDHVDLVTGHGDGTGGAHWRWMREHGIDPAALTGPANQLDHDYDCPQAVRTALPEEFYSTFYIRDRALDWLDAHGGAGQPFFLNVSFPDPHHPFTPPGRYWDLYRPGDMTLPDSFHSNTEPPPPLKWLREAEAKGAATISPQTYFSVNEDQARQAMALTCGMIAMIDDAVGAVLDRLEAMGLMDNTVLIFTADHGDFMGDHGILLKGPLHYQSLVRVPFLWKEPGRPTIPQAGGLASTVDIAQTVLARAGLTPYAGMQGMDLAPALESGETGRSALLIEEEQCKTVAGFDEIPRLRTLVTETHRMTIFEGHAWGELYDLVNDPLECHNLWDRPEAAEIKAAMQFAMIQEMTRIADRSPWPLRLA